jgi:hypothetical protein
MFTFIGYFSRNRISCLTLSGINLSFTSIFGRKKTFLQHQAVIIRQMVKKRKPLKIPPSKISLFVRKAFYIHGIKKSLFRGKNPVTPIEEEDTCLDVVSRPVPAFRIRLALLPAPLHQ